MPVPGYFRIFAQSFTNTTTIMKKLAKQLTDLIGNTPLLELGKFSAHNGIDKAIIAKVEYFNPGGSVKDRIALAMIDDAERSGFLKPGATIIEPTSGNTGVGLSLVSAVKGYRLILTMPDTMSIERRNLVKAYGAEVHLTPGAEGMAGAIRAAEELRDSIPGSVILQQFENKANPKKHYDTTANEIWSDTHGGHHIGRGAPLERAQPQHQDNSRRTVIVAGTQRRQSRPPQDSGHRCGLHSGYIRCRSDRRGGRRGQRRRHTRRPPTGHARRTARWNLIGSRRICRHRNSPAYGIRKQEHRGVVARHRRTISVNGALCLRRISALTGSGDVA